MPAYSEWIQDVMFYMMMAKVSEVEGVTHESGNTLLRVMLNNKIDFRGMHSWGVEAHDVPNKIRTAGSRFVIPR